ncbi:hypothetical protein G7Y79_00031g065380 [Physcia stellaris]|nr:hypothetical protein G7Y79_00031g065380 [Physcia stellaris]
MTFVILISLLLLFMASSNISFYFVTDAEIHWRQISSFHQDAAGFKTLMYGLTGFLITAACILIFSWVSASYVYEFTGSVLGVFSWITRWAWSTVIRPLLCCSRKSRAFISPADYEDAEYLLKEPGVPSSPVSESLDGISGDSAKPSKTCRSVVLAATAVLCLLSALRPHHDYAYLFLSWSVLISPFVGAPYCFIGVDVAGFLGDDRWLKGRSSLGVAPHWDFLPSESIPGFEDWYSCTGNCTERLHYDAKKDPLHISNLEDPILDTLREVFDQKNANIKHVILIKLESTRSDVFPLLKDTRIIDTIQESYGHDIPEEVQRRLGNLTPTAEYLTGFTGAFSNRSSTAASRGGIVATDAFTTGTYTLKSLPGSLCGITPLAADFNREYNHHIYQPCLPHIFNLLNTIPNDTKGSKVDEYQTWPWKSLYMQSVTDTYDNQNLLTPKLGFHDWITKETLEDPKKWKHPPTTEPVCLYGYPDEELRESLRDAINDAEESHQRLFLAHLTGATHEPWTLPEPWDFDRELVGHSNGGMYRNLKRYLNAIGYGDWWMKTVFEILEETGVANDTLVVMAGDHGISILEDYITPYDDPHVGAFRVPLILSHPHLPPVTINSSVSLNQVLPTILDLLISSDSLPSASASAASKVLSLYEGQSLIRPQRYQTSTGHPDYQFQVMNTGGTWLSMRSRTKPYRLVVPLVPDIEWRFSDLASDPTEEHAIFKFDARDFAGAVRHHFGIDAESWVNDAAEVARWWVKENRRRWRYDPCKAD